MALAITATPLVPHGGRFKGRKVVNVKFIGDASCAATGYVVAAASVGLRIVESGVMGADRNGTVRFAIIPSATASSDLTSSSNQFTLAAFMSNNATPGASNASVGSATVDGIIFGY
jgi:prephenate dehydratase